MMFRMIGADCQQNRIAPGFDGGQIAYPLRLAAAARIETKLSNHSFRATGITAYLKKGGTLENVAALISRASTRTTQLHDRRRAIIPSEAGDD